MVRLQAAHHGCSMEQKARDILRRAVQDEATGAGFAQNICKRFAGLGVDELPIPVRRAARPPIVPID